MRKLALVLLMQASSLSLAQTRADSIYQSIMPLQCDISFFCGGVRQNDSTRTYSWGPGVFENIGSHYQSTRYQVKVLGDTEFLYTSDTSGGYPCNFGWQLDVILDTVNQFISVNAYIHDEANRHSISTDKFRYTSSLGHFLGATSSTGASMSFPPYEYCQCTRGWVSIGGAYPPAKVEENNYARSQFALLVSWGGILNFSFNHVSENIHIFDLFGREVGRIDVPAGAESAELSTSHIPPGMYIAQMGTQAVKFVVR